MSEKELEDLASDYRVHDIIDAIKFREMMTQDLGMYVSHAGIFTNGPGYLLVHHEYQVNVDVESLLNALLEDPDFLARIKQKLEELDKKSPA